ncbi:recombinase family protein [Caballeronia sp. AZ10_KS36]|uniref:recombinase family protein n=1 Tax=Caballeronia sp. AZ10_KS36 TaxID=2921757 RepID=UPI002028680C|nr:recombinase family protein [Caballeronia sp. AZ10_KS36]
MNSKGQNIGYIRVSTTDQKTARQLEGIALDRVFEEKASAKGNRPVLQEALMYAREGDTFYVHSIDRLARDTRQLLDIVERLVSKGVTVTFPKNSLTFAADRNDHTAKLMLTMLGAFADFEHSMIRERQREGIAAAKERGVYKQKLTPAQLEAIRARLENGELKKDVAAAYGVSRPTLDSYLRK